MSASPLHPLPHLSPGYPPPLAISPWAPLPCLCDPGILVCSSDCRPGEISLASLLGSMLLLVAALLPPPLLLILVAKPKFLPASWISSSASPQYQSVPRSSEDPDSQNACTLGRSSLSPTCPSAGSQPPLLGLVPCFLSRLPAPSPITPTSHPVCLVSSLQNTFLKESKSDKFSPLLQILMQDKDQTHCLMGIRDCLQSDTCLSL